MIIFGFVVNGQDYASFVASKSLHAITVALVSVLAKLPGLKLLIFTCVTLARSI